MSNYEFDPLAAELETLAAEESAYRIRLFQHTTLRFKEAQELDATHGGGYLQGIVAETPEPTTAFRMDSKRNFITGGAIGKKNLIVYVPKSQDPEQFFTKAWYKNINHDGVEAMFELDETYHPYETTDDIREEEVVASFEDLDEEEDVLRGLVKAAIRQKKGSKQGMCETYAALKDGYTIVPFYS